MHLADRRMYAVKLGRRADGDHTVEVLSRAIRESQPAIETGRDDVAELARDVGRKLGLTPEQVDETMRAAKLQDVGMVAIPDAILAKPGPLTDDEWAYIRKHTLIGERIVAAAPPLLPVARLVRSSHERWDGAGYPDGLAGESIPLGSRVVFACDSLDAMISERPYRQACSMDEALAELRRCAGTQFDPDVVDALAAVLERPTTGRKPVSS
jgi:HD-GYP domain-containing protein (c-di-GMP phosphodiesterase class II)